MGSEVLGSLLSICAHAPGISPVNSPIIWTVFGLWQCLQTNDTVVVPSISRGSLRRSRPPTSSSAHGWSHGWWPFSKNHLLALRNFFRPSASRSQNPHLRIGGPVRQIVQTPLVRTVCCHSAGR